MAGFNEVLSHLMPILTKEEKQIIENEFDN